MCTGIGWPSGAGHKEKKHINTTKLIGRGASHGKEVHQHSRRVQPLVKSEEKNMFSFGIVITLSIFTL